MIAYDANGRSEAGFSDAPTAPGLGAPTPLIDSVDSTSVRGWTGCGDSLEVLRRTPLVLAGTRARYRLPLEFRRRWVFGTISLVIQNSGKVSSTSFADFFETTTTKTTITTTATMTADELSQSMARSTLREAETVPPTAPKAETKSASAALPIRNAAVTGLFEDEQAKYAGPRLSKRIQACPAQEMGEKLDLVIRNCKRHVVLASHS